MFVWAGLLPEGLQTQCHRCKQGTMTVILDYDAIAIIAIMIKIIMMMIAIMIVMAITLVGAMLYLT